MANKSIFRKSFVRLHEDILHAPPPIYDLLQPGEFLETTFVRNDGRPYHYLDYVGSHQYSLYQADGYGAGPSKSGYGKNASDDYVALRYRYGARPSISGYDENGSDDYVPVRYPDENGDVSSSSTDENGKQKAGSNGKAVRKGNGAAKGRKSKVLDSCRGLFGTGKIKEVRKSENRDLELIEELLKQCGGQKVERYHELMKEHERRRTLIPIKSVQDLKTVQNKPL